MKVRAILLVASFAMTACTPSGPGGAKPFDAMSGDEHLACAVDISAYTYLMAGAKVPQDSDLAGKSALALGWHRNAYAIPQGKDEEAGLINARREELLAEDKSEAIAERAAACIASAIAKHQTG